MEMESISKFDSYSRYSVRQVERLSKFHGIPRLTTLYRMGVTEPYLGRGGLFYAPY